MFIFKAVELLVGIQQRRQDDDDDVAAAPQTVKAGAPWNCCCCLVVDNDTKAPCGLGHVLTGENPNATGTPGTAAEKRTSRIVGQRIAPTRPILELEDPILLTTTAAPPFNIYLYRHLAVSVLFIALFADCRI